MAPADVSKKNERQIMREIYPVVIKMRTDKFNVGDKVRISKYKRIFDKSYRPNWTYELFTIYKKLNTDPHTYLLKDAKDRIMEGCFYEKELMKTEYPNVFLIEKINQ